MKMWIFGTILNLKVRGNEREGSGGGSSSLSVTGDIPLCACVCACVSMHVLYCMHLWRSEDNINSFLRQRVSEVKFRSSGVYSKNIYSLSHLIDPRSNFDIAV